MNYFLRTSFLGFLMSGSLYGMETVAQHLRQFQDTLVTLYAELGKIPYAKPVITEPLIRLLSLEVEWEDEALTNILKDIQISITAETILPQKVSLGTFNNIPENLGPLLVDNIKQIFTQASPHIQFLLLKNKGLMLKNKGLIEISGKLSTQVPQSLIYDTHLIPSPAKASESLDAIFDSLFKGTKIAPLRRFINLHPEIEIFKGKTSEDFTAATNSFNGISLEKRTAPIKRIYIIKDGIKNKIFDSEAEQPTLLLSSDDAEGTVTTPRAEIPTPTAQDFATAEEALKRRYIKLKKPNWKSKTPKTK